MTSIGDIARELGISRSTVSKALRGSSDINPDTVAAVRQTARELGYDMSRLHDRTGGTGTVGAVFTELRSEYYSGIFDSFRQRIEADGRRVITMLSDFDSEDRLLGCIDYLIRSRVIGILFLTELDIDVHRFRELIAPSGIPAVLISRMGRIDFCDVISVNHSLGVRMGVEHLYELGHRKFAFIGENFTKRREGAFRETLENLGIVPDEKLIKVSGGRYCAGGYSAAKELFSLPPEERPTALFAAYDHLAYGAMKAASEAGISIPDDLSVIGVDDNQLSAYISPGLSSVRMPVEDVGSRAYGILTSRINGDRSPFETVYLTPELKLRESVAPPKNR